MSTGGGEVVAGGMPSLGGANGTAGVDPSGAGAAPEAAGGTEPPSVAAVGGCLDGILGPDGTRCYLISEASAAWQAARAECEALQSVLVKVETAEEDAFIDALVGVNLWLGASDTLFDNVFTWTDGSPVVFGHWGPNQPDRFPGSDCIEKRETLGRFWFDQPCDNPRAFICEREVGGAALVAE